MIYRLAEYCLLSERLRRLAVAFLAGAIAALSMPPIGFSLALAVSLPLAVWLLDGVAGSSDQRGIAAIQVIVQAAGVGWAWGFGFHVAGLWWLGSAFLVESDRFLWALPLGVIGLPAALGLFSAFSFGVARAIWRGRISRILVFACAITLGEYLRGNDSDGISLECTRDVAWRTSRDRASRFDRGF